MQGHQGPMTPHVGESDPMPMMEPVPGEHEGVTAPPPAPPLTAPLDDALTTQPAAPPEEPNDAPEPEMSPEEQQARERAAMAALYGDQFPQIKDEPQPQDWAAWAEDLWDRHQPGKRRRMHLTQRNRLFYKGVQWVSANGFGPWIEPPKPREQARAVHNLIKPALDQRAQIVSEQRPGFRTKPITQDSEKVKKAEAQQYALEYQYDQQGMRGITKETRFHNGTDGVAFWHLHWDDQAGPWYEMTTGETMRLGDVRTRILKIEQVVVSANATTNIKPSYWVIKETISTAEAVTAHGVRAMGTRRAVNTGRANVAMGLIGNSTGPGDSDPLEGQDTVDRFTVYCERSEYLPEGLTVITVDGELVVLSPLVQGVVPMVRVPDGTADPAFFPAPEMDDWVEHQIRVNAAISKWVESVRLNSGGRFLTRPRAISNDTLVAGTLSAIEVRGTGPISESVLPVQGFSVGTDIKELIQAERQLFEDKSGWNASSRGQYSGDTSGRAILALREQLERVFAEPVNAVAEAMVEWGKVTLQFMRWGYDIPRLLGIMGHGRPDLARAISSEDFDEIADVEIDPETMTPMPRALRLFLLDQMFEKGLMPADEYRKRLPFAYTRNLQTPNDTQQARAFRVAEAIKANKPIPPIRWQDNEAIHQDVLESEILLRDDLEEAVVQAADARWKALAQQSATKMAPPPGPAVPPDPKDGPSLSPRLQPMLGTNPSMASAPANVMGNPNAPLMGGSDAHSGGA